MMERSILLNSCLFKQHASTSLAPRFCMALPVASFHQQTEIPFTLARKTLDNLLVGGRQQLVHVLHPLLLPVLVLRLTPRSLLHQQQPVPVRHLAVRQPRRVRRVVHDVLHAVLELLLQLLLRARRHARQVLLLRRVAVKRLLPSLQPPTLLPALLLRLTPPARAHRRRHLLLKLLAQRGRAAVEPSLFADLRLTPWVSLHVQQRLPDQLRLQGDRGLKKPVRTEHALARVLGCLRSGRVVQRPQGVVAGGLEQVDLALDRGDAFDLLVHAHIAEQMQGLDLRVRGPGRRHDARDGLEHHAVGEKQTRQQEALAVGLLVRAQQLRVSEAARPHVAHLVQRLVQNVLTRLDRLGVRRPRVAPPLRTRVAHLLLPLSLTHHAVAHLAQLLLHRVGLAGVGLLDRPPALLVLALHVLHLLLDGPAHPLDRLLDALLSFTQLVVVPLEHLRADARRPLGWVVFTSLTPHAPTFQLLVQLRLLLLRLDEARGPILLPFISSSRSHLQLLLVLVQLRREVLLDRRHLRLVPRLRLTHATHANLQIRHLFLLLLLELPQRRHGLAFVEACASHHHATRTSDLHLVGERRLFPLADRLVQQHGHAFLG